MKSRRLRCIKFFLAFFNIIAILFGLLLMATCVMNMRESKTRPSPDLSRGVLSFLFTLGLGLVITAILGCVGALREHIKLLYVHACFFMFLVLVEFVVGVGGAILTVWVGGSNELRVHFYKNTTLEHETVKYQNFWDALQSENQCCGVDGPQDYRILGRDIPPSCCSSAHAVDMPYKTDFHNSCLKARSYYDEGCEDALRKKKSFKGKLFITTGVIFGLLEILCIVFAFWMAQTKRMDRRKLQQNLQAHFET